MNRNPTVLRPESAVLLIVDFQQRILEAMEQSDIALREAVRLQSGFALLGLPILAIEQSPQKLGPTVPMLTEKSPPNWILAKTAFSAWCEAPFRERLLSLHRPQIVVVGIESHVCVLQTVLDLLHNGFQAHIPAMAVASRSEGNKQNALERMRQAGAVVTNTESILFELIGDAQHPQFKAVQKLIL